MTFVPWTQAEVVTLRDAYTAGGYASARMALPHRSVNAIHRKAEHLGLSRRPRWTGSDLRKLRDLWGTIPIPQISKRLGRTPATVYWKGQQLGLGLGAPQGSEHLSTSAKRLGFAVSTLRLIFRWAGVRIERAMARPTNAKHHLTHIVDEHDATVAVERWCKSEAVHTAATRLGLIGETLRQWLVDAGHVPPERVGAHWRVPSEVIDRVVAERNHLYETTQSVSRAALRIGVHKHTLTAWLLDAGVSRGERSNVWRVARDVVDRIAAERMSRATTRVRRRAA